MRRPPKATQSGSRLRRSNRRGVILICVLAAVVIVTAVAAASIQASLRSRREAKASHKMLQTEFLLDAGIAQAKTQLANNKSYTGESWIVPAESLDGYQGKVVIELNSDDRDLVGVTAKLFDVSKDEPSTNETQSKIIPAGIQPRMQRSLEFRLSQKAPE